MWAYSSMFSAILKQIDWIHSIKYFEHFFSVDFLEYSRSIWLEIKPVWRKTKQSWAEHQQVFHGKTVPDFRFLGSSRHSKPFGIIPEITFAWAPVSSTNTLKSLNYLIISRNLPSFLKTATASVCAWRYLMCPSVFQWKRTSSSPNAGQCAEFVRSKQCNVYE